MLVDRERTVRCTATQPTRFPAAAGEARLQAPPALQRPSELRALAPSTATDHSTCRTCFTHHRLLQAKNSSRALTVCGPEATAVNGASSRGDCERGLETSGQPDFSRASVSPGDAVSVA